MEIIVFHTVAIIFSVLFALVAIKIIFDAITQGIKERRQERDAADAMIKTLSPEMRDHLKRVRGSYMRRHIIRWEKERGMQ